MIISFLKKIEKRGLLNSLKKNPKVKILGNIKLGDNNHFVLYPDAKKIEIGNNLDLKNYIHIKVLNNAELILGDNLFFNNFCSINCLEYISIGDNTLFGENVKLYDHNHDYQRTENNLVVFPSKFTTAPITIGKNCWLGSNVTVLKGVTIGDNCIIGAGCVIHKDIPANSTIFCKQELIIKPN